MNPKVNPKMNLKEGELYPILFIAIFGGLDIILVIGAHVSLNEVSMGARFLYRVLVVCRKMYRRGAGCK